MSVGTPIADLIRYRMRSERIVRRLASPDLPTDRGSWKIHAFHYELEDQTHVALVMGEYVFASGLPPVRKGALEWEK